MDDKKKNYPSKVSLILRIVVSAYLLYLVWGLRDAPASHTGGWRIFFIASMALFTVAAAIVGVNAIRAYIKGEYDDPKDRDET